MWRCSYLTRWGIPYVVGKFWRTKACGSVQEAKNELPQPFRNQEKEYEQEEEDEDNPYEGVNLQGKLLFLYFYFYMI